MTKNQMENYMLMEDLKGAGFQARINLNGNCLVSLNRRINQSEIKKVLMDLGYEESQFEIERLFDNKLLVKAVV